MSTTNVENNPGAASVILLNNRDKNLEVACSVIMAENDVEKNPLKITDAKMHECYFDKDKHIAAREYNGKMHTADFDIMQEERNSRFAQNRDIEKVSEEDLAKSGIHINEKGEIVRDSEEMTH